MLVIGTADCPSFPNPTLLTHTYTRVEHPPRRDRTRATSGNLSPVLTLAPACVNFLARDGTNTDALQILFSSQLAGTLVIGIWDHSLDKIRIWNLSEISDFLITPFVRHREPNCDRARRPHRVIIALKHNTFLNPTGVIGTNFGL